MEAKLFGSWVVSCRQKYLTVKPAIPYGTVDATPEDSSLNYWTRSGFETLKVVVGGKQVTFDVQKDDHAIIYIPTRSSLPSSVGSDAWNSLFTNHMVLFFLLLCRQCLCNGLCVLIDLRYEGFLGAVVS